MSNHGAPFVSDVKTDQKRSYHGHFERSRKKKSAVPDRWERYTPFGQPIPNSRFIAFKVPLRAEIAQNVPEADGSHFTPDAMIASFRSRNIDVGLVIDLTFTSKYYGSTVIEGLFGRHDIAYRKIFTQGHVIPSTKHIREFQGVVTQFLNSDPTRLVGVHCTHGLNRTGYMICRYLIERLGWDPEDAIRGFDRARGHEQERQNYLDDLRKLKSAVGKSGIRYADEDGDGSGIDGRPTQEVSEGANSDDHREGTISAINETGGGNSRKDPRNWNVPRAAPGFEGGMTASGGGRRNGKRSFQETSVNNNRGRPHLHHRHRGEDPRTGKAFDGTTGAMTRQQPGWSGAAPPVIPSGAAGGYDRDSDRSSRDHRDRCDEASWRPPPVFQPYERLDPYRVDNRKTKRNNGCGGSRGGGGGSRGASSSAATRNPGRYRK